MRKIFLWAIIIFLIWPFSGKAAVLDSAYPRLANYFLKWSISDQEAKDLAKWDLLVLDMEVAENSRKQLLEIRRLNPRVVILAYLTSQEILDEVDGYSASYLRQALDSQIIDGWRLKDASGRLVVNWPQTHMLNLTEAAPRDFLGRRFNDYLPEFVNSQIKASGLFDGVFYDNIWGDVAWVNGGNLDFNNDGLAESPAEANALWAAGVKKMLTKTRSLVGPDFIIVGNGRVYDGYQSLLNGMMLENFPSSWENGGTWSGSMSTYLRLPALNQAPPVNIINVYKPNQQDYQNMRFGLASALLGSGFYSFDYDVSSHNQTWWYDEYEVDLGAAQGAAYNLLGGQDQSLRPGLWRRDFQRGLALVNSTAQEQRYVFDKENLEKIKGEQAPLVNSGEKISYLKLAPRDGIILWKRNTSIKNFSFTNGYFYRVFNAAGESVQNGFFSYLGSFPGEEQIINASEGGILSGGAGQVKIYQGDRLALSFRPYDQLFKGRLNLSVSFKGDLLDRLAIGPNQAGGPQVRIFSPDGRLRSSFFAYDKNLRSGVQVALGDINGDGEAELITGPGKGEKPLVKIFSLTGELKGSFLAYDEKFLGGVSVAVADVWGDSRAEIITAPGPGGGPQVRIFFSNGQAIHSFFAYDKSYHGGIQVTASDLNEDGRPEILVGLKNFY